MDSPPSSSALVPGLSILLLTFNCARIPVQPSHLGPQLASQFHDAEPPDLVVFSLQEIAPVAYSFLGGAYLTPYFDQVAQTVAVAAPAVKYSLAFAHNVGMTALVIFAKSTLLTHIVHIQAAGVGVGVWSMGNKGAVGARIKIASSENITDQNQEEASREYAGDETVDLTFVAAHLAPMEHLVSRRNQDWEAIVKNMIFSSPKSPASGNSEGASESQPLLSSAASSKPTTIFSPQTNVFVLGDLNYRTSDTPPGLDSHERYSRGPDIPVESSFHYRHLKEKDQLNRERRAGRTMQGLDEYSLMFPPTYKYKHSKKDVEMQDERWNFAPHRWPSWCDRILYRSSSLQVKSYDALRLQPTSDHRPVALSCVVGTKSEPDEHEERSLLLFPPNTAHGAERAAARRREVVVGGLAWLSTTGEGLAALFGMVAGILGGVYMVKRFLVLD